MVNSSLLVVPTGIVIMTAIIVLSVAFVNARQGRACCVKVVLLANVFRYAVILTSFCAVAGIMALDF